MVKLQRSKIAFALLAATLSLPTYAISIEQAWQQAKQNDPNYEKSEKSASSLARLAYRVAAVRYCRV